MTDGAALRVVGSYLCDQSGKCTCDSACGDSHHPDCGWVPISTLAQVYTALADVAPVGYWPVHTTDARTLADWKATARDLHQLYAFTLKKLQRVEKELRRHTDDTCYGRCDSHDGMRTWFQYETRSLLDPDEAHEVLDMLLNKLNPTTT